MSILNKLIPAFLFASFLIGGVHSQDNHFSQITNSPIFYNPAAAGSQFGNLRASIAYRDQWNALSTSPYTTMYGAVDYGFFSKKNAGNRPYVGLGVTFFHDYAGPGKLTTTTGTINIAVNVPLSRLHRISAGIYGGFGQKYIDYESFTWDNQYDSEIYGANTSLDPREYTLKSRTYYPDIAFGVMYNYGKEHSAIRSNDEVRFTIGYALHHILQPNVSLTEEKNDRLNMKHNAYFEGAFAVNGTNMTLKPAMIANIQLPHTEFVFGTMLNFRLKGPSRHTGFIKESSIGIGGYYRVLDAFILAARFEVSRFALGISYESTNSSLQQNPFGRGGMEVTLSFGLPNPNGIMARYSRTYF